MKSSWPEHDGKLQSKGSTCHNYSIEYECNLSILEACFKPFIMATCSREANWVHALSTHTSKVRSIYICCLLLHALRPSLTTSSFLHHALLELPLGFLQRLALLPCLIIATSHAKAAEKSGCKFYGSRE